MRTSGGLTFLFGDQLGSTSVTYRLNDGQIIWQLYRPWGEVRYSSGSLPTQYQYTGQYTYAADFGLYFYNARWYDSQLGRFNQADSIVPNPGDPQAWDRYAAMANNPVRFNDPSGHSIDCGMGDPYCNAGKLDVETRAQDLAQNNKREERVRNSRIYWKGLSTQDQLSLTEGGFDPGAYNDFLDDETRIATLLEDPAFYLSVAIGGGTKFVLSTIAGACADGICSNELEATQKGITVLGRYPTYLDVAEDVGGNVFNVPTETWNKLSLAEQWSVNQKFLDEAIARGDYFYLASQWAEAQVGTFFREELEYLFSAGYTLSVYQNYLMPPPTP